MLHWPTRNLQWHGQLPLRQQPRVDFGILGQRPVRLECRPDGARGLILPKVVLPILRGQPPGVVGTQIEELLQILPFAPGDEHLGDVPSAVEGDVPDLRIGQQRLPGLCSGHRRVRQTQPGDLVGEVRGV